MERWKLIPDYDYSISDHGRVRNEQTGYISCGFKNKDGYVNTASENVLYSYSHGNATTNRGVAVLTWEIVREIRKDYNDNYNDVIEYARENCNKYRVCKKTIRRILYNQTWIED